MVGRVFTEGPVITSGTEDDDRPYGGESADGVISNARSHCHNLRFCSHVTYLNPVPK